MTYVARLLSLHLTLILFSTAIAADDRVFVVPRNEIYFDLVLDDLPQNPADDAAVAWVPPSRGHLVSIDQGFRYFPDASFRRKGSDSFRYTAVTPGGPTEFLVFLTADLSNESGLPGEDPSSDGETVAGGNTAIEIDIGTRGDPPGIFSASTWILAETRNLGVRRFEIVLNEDLQGTLTIQARAFDRGGNGHATAPLTIEPGGHRVELDWWIGTARARNGGMLLRIDGVLMAAVTRLDNFLDTEPTWFFPTLDSGNLPVQTNPSLNGHTWGLPLPFPPRFADTFESPVLFGWSIPSGPDLGTRGFEIAGRAATDGAGRDGPPVGEHRRYRFPAPRPADRRTDPSRPFHRSCGRQMRSPAARRATHLHLVSRPGNQPDESRVPPRGRIFESRGHALSLGGTAQRHGGLQRVVERLCPPRRARCGVVGRNGRRCLRRWPGAANPKPQRARAGARARECGRAPP